MESLQMCKTFLIQINTQRTPWLLFPREESKIGILKCALFKQTDLPFPVCLCAKTVYD